MGGKESASARYIYTQLNKITRAIFHEDDDHVVKYLEDDGQMVEPSWYIPILPMVLVNGAEGIGTGWSTNVSKICILRTFINHYSLFMLRSNATTQET
jgi:DNA topoisomerase-2